MAKTRSSEIRAAGTVLLRPAGEPTVESTGQLEVCVLHRPSHKDWSLPKGKLEQGEDLVTAAWRETLEETGENALFGVPLSTLRYRVEGRWKSVNYWRAMVADSDGAFTPGREIDRLEWLEPRSAVERLTYPRDKALVQQAVSIGPTSPLIILRHAQAMRRVRWGKNKDDAQRPLTKPGQRQSAKIQPVLRAFGIQQIIASDTSRCVDTVAPYANHSKCPTTLEALFSEAGYRPKGASLDRLSEVFADQTPTVLCTHRPVLPTLLRHLANELGVKATDKRLDPSLPPGGFIVIHRSFDEPAQPKVVAIERHTGEPI